MVNKTGIENPRSSLLRNLIVLSEIIVVLLFRLETNITFLPTDARRLQIPNGWDFKNSNGLISADSLSCACIGNINIKHNGIVDWLLRSIRAVWISVILLVSCVHTLVLLFV